MIKPKTLRSCLDYIGSVNILRRHEVHAAVGAPVAHDSPVVYRRHGKGGRVESRGISPTRLGTTPGINQNAPYVDVSDVYTARFYLA